MRRSSSNRLGRAFYDTAQLRNKLQEEITKLDRQLQAFRLSDNPADFAKLASYEEMITARRKMLSRLPR